ncbi:MAG: NERD domain-containing protein [Lachnospiraceae bacterium]|nr:NERD domain-containing protein [Lachnospiraceae bacterium]
MLYFIAAISLLSSFILISLILTICLGAISVKNYYKSIYYFSTQKDIKELIKNKGIRGEYLIYRKLSKVYTPGDDAYYIFNAYIPTGNEYKTTDESDIIFIHNTGIYIIESKNYRKVSWPEIASAVNQNCSDVRYVKKYLDDFEELIYPVVVFGNECSKKNLRTYSESYIDAYIFSYKNLTKDFDKLLSEKPVTLDKSIMKEAYGKLKECEAHSDEERRMHIDECNNLNRYIFSKEEVTGKYENQYCVNCKKVTLCVPLEKGNREYYRCTVCSRKFTPKNNKNNSSKNTNAVKNDNVINKPQIIDYFELGISYIYCEKCKELELCIPFYQKGQAYYKCKKCGFVGSWNREEEIQTEPTGEILGYCLKCKDGLIECVKISRQHNKFYKCNSCDYKSKYSLYESEKWFKICRCKKCDGIVKPYKLEKYMRYFKCDSENCDYEFIYDCYNDKINFMN